MPQKPGHIPWYYSMKKSVEQQSEDLALVKSALDGLQKKIAGAMHGLEQRVEALEGAKAPESKQETKATASDRLHDGPSVDKLETRDVSMTILDARFDLLRKDIAAQLATCSGVRENLQKELGGGEAFLATDSDLQACVLTTSRRVARLERLHEKCTEMQAVPDIGTEQFQEVVEDAGTQNLLPSQELGAFRQSSESIRTNPPGVPLHTSASVGQVAQTSGNGLGRSVCSLGGRFARKPGIVNSRIQHFEGRIQEVVGRATLPDGMQQIVSLDAHLPPPEHFHALQQAAPSPCGETQIATATSTSRVAAMSVPWPPHATTKEQCLSFHGQNASESCGGSTYASIRIPGDGSEISSISLACLDQDSVDVKPDVSSKSQSREEPQLCLARLHPVRMSFTLPANAVPAMVLSPRSPPPLFTHRSSLSRPYRASCQQVALDAVACPYA